MDLNAPVKRQNADWIKKKKRTPEYATFRDPLKRPTLGQRDM